MKTPSRVEQEEGHAPPPQQAPGAPLTRVLLWCGVGLTVLLGLYLFFRYQREISPLFGGP